MSHADCVIRTSELSPTPQARMRTGGNQVPMVLSENGNSRAISEDLAPPIKTTTRHVLATTCTTQGKPGQGNPVVLMDKHQHGG